MHEAVQFIKLNETNNSSPCDKISLSKRTEKEDNNSTTGSTNKLESDINEARDNELRSMYSIKDCTVPISRISQFSTSEAIHLDDKDKATLLNLDENSISENEEWQRESDDIHESESNSDWEEEYLSKLSKKKPSQNRRSNKTVNLIENANFPGPSQIRNNTCVKGLEYSSIQVTGLQNRNPINVSKKSKTIANEHLGKRESRLIDYNVNRSAEAFPSVQKVNTKNVVINSRSFRLHRPFQAKIDGKNFVFIPQNKCVTVDDVQTKPNDNIQTKKSTCTMKGLSYTKLKQNSSIAQKAKDSDKIKRTKYRSILPKQSSPLSPSNPSLLPVPDFTYQFATNGNNGVDTLKTFLLTPSAPTFPMVLAVNSTLSSQRSSQSYCPEQQDDPSPLVPDNTHEQKSSIPNKAKDNDKSKSTSYCKILPKPFSPTCEVPKTSGTDGVSPPDSEDDVDDPSLLPVPDFTYHCKKCDKLFNMIDQYHYHMRYSKCGGYERKLRHQCDICGKRFNASEKLDAHRNSHNNSRPFKCLELECDRRFNSKGARHMHHKKYHLKSEKIRYLCSYCGYITPSREHILAHEKVHQLPEGTEAPKPFKCLDCGKGFISKWHFGRHKKDRHSLKKCTTCSAEFKTENLLQRHMEDEHGIASKTYICEECGKQFRQSYILRQHHKIMHTTKARIFSCDICNKIFKRSCNLRQHMITHSDERPISCADCGDTFKRLTHLKQHISAFHGDGRK